MSDYSIIEAGQLVERSTIVSADINTKFQLETLDVEWAALKALRDNGQLVPGRSYRITDYVATTNGDMNSRSANHPFDIIVVADDVDALNEDAHAIQHEGDTYFANSNLAAWKVKYCLDNDTSRFAWAVADNASGMFDGDVPFVGGRGVVYQLVDEFDNDVPYDFKGLQFQRWAITIVTSTKLTPEAVTGYITQFVYASNGGKCFAYKSSNISVNGTVMTVDSSTSAYYYTFDSGSGLDSSLSGVRQGVYGNKIGESISSDRAKLNGIVFFGDNCHSNTFGNSCSYNTFFNNCSNNAFGNYCYYNIFGNTCSGNTFGYNFYSNTFGKNCYYNTFSSGCYSNTFGNNCSYNTFIGGCSYNTFGNYCMTNTFCNGFSFNTFGNDCAFNAFGNTFTNNNFGNHCESNIFGDGCSYITFGTSSETKSYCRYITVESGNKYIYLNPTGTTLSSAYYQNVTIKSGVNNTTTYKTITDPNVKQDFNTTYKPTNSQEISI